MIQVDIPIGFRTNVCAYFHNIKKRWVIQYYLPSEMKIRMLITLQEGTSEKKARDIAKRKEFDLARGLLTEKEHKKLNVKNYAGTLWTIADALNEYRSITGINKSAKQREKELFELPKRFRYFEENFSIKMINEITENHLIDYRNDLIKKVQAGLLSPASAPSFLASVKKVFNWLEENKKISVNPARNLKPVKIKIEDKVRRKYFTSEQILKVMEVEYFPKNGFPIKEFFLFARETGARIGEILHLEWSDIKDGIWYIHIKKDCPTSLGIGWTPKWGKERKVCLSLTARKILEMIPQVPSVGYIKNNPIPIPANFVFVVPDRKSSGQYRRVDDIDRSWKGLMKAAGFPDHGADSFVRHDLRRTWNIEKRDIGGLDDLLRSQQLGHSEKVNQTHYDGQLAENLEKILAEIRGSKGENLLKLIGSKKSNLL